MTEFLFAALLLLILINLLMSAWLLLRFRRLQMPALPLDPILQNQKEGQERAERVVREEIGRNRTAPKPAKGAESFGKN